jgi:hypothetical protein
MSHEEEVKILVIVNQRGGKCGADSCRRFHKKRQEGDRRQICRKGKSASRQETDAVGMATVSGTNGLAKRQEVTRSARRLEGVGGRKGDRND